MTTKLARVGLATLMGLGIIAGTETAANAATTCQAAYSIVIPGGRASITECYRNGNEVRVNGTVTDRSSDGLCAQVYATYNNYSGTDYSPRACPEGQTDSFTFPWRAGTDAFVYLRNV